MPGRAGLSLLGGITCRGGDRQRGRHALGGVAGRAADGIGDGGLAATAFLALLEPLARCELVARSALQGLSAALDGAGALLASAQGEAQLGLGGAGLARLEFEAVSLVGAGLLVLSRLGRGLVQAGREGVEFLAVGGHGQTGFVDRSVGALGLGLGLTGRGTQRPQLFGDGGHPGVGLVEGLECRVDPDTDLLGSVLGLREGEPRPLDHVGCLCHRGPGLLDRGLELDQALART